MLKHFIIFYFYFLSFDYKKNLIIFIPYSIFKSHLVFTVLASGLMVERVTGGTVNPTIMRYLQNAVSI